VALKITSKSKSYMAITIFVFLFVSSGFADNSSSVKIAKGTGKEDVQIKERYKHQNGPPAHAPAQGYRAKFKYRYYPCCRVYFDVERGLYFYLKGETWEVGISLPSQLKNDLGKYVNLELDTDRPYLFNKEHNKKYSSKQSSSKKRRVNFFTKLWILLFAR
jgi:hypothetical protein